MFQKFATIVLLSFFFAATLAYGDTTLPIQITNRTYTSYPFGFSVDKVSVKSFEHDVAAEGLGTGSKVILHIEGQLKQNYCGQKSVIFQINRTNVTGSDTGIQEFYDVMLTTLDPQMATAFNDMDCLMLAEGAKTPFEADMAILPIAWGRNYKELSWKYRFISAVKDFELPTNVTSVLTVTLTKKGWEVKLDQISSSFTPKLN